MATFTRVSDDETPSLTIDTSRRLSKIDRNIYSGFTEHMGRCIYGGIYDPANPLSDENGFRKDVLEALKELKMPVVRYPGGNFCATYHWIDGVGPKEDRPSRPELAWVTTETNQFGTDEFMKWCKVLGTEPYICLNFGTGTLDEALAWVEYCNGTRDTHYANLRRKNGHPEPYNVKYWALGNEMWGEWQVNQMTPEQYAQQALTWAKALKLLDPSIKLILGGSDGLEGTLWDSHILHHCLQPIADHFSPFAKTPLIDMHSIHIYTIADKHVPNALAPLSAEKAIQTTSALIDAALIANKVVIKDSSWRPKICFDEWNVWDPKRAEGEKGGEEKYTLSDALAVGIWLNVFVRQSDKLGMACLAQAVNVLGPLLTSEKGMVKQTIWWPLWLFSKYMNGERVSAWVKCGAYEGETEPKWLGAMREIGWLDVSACVDEDGWCNVAVVNVNEQRGWKTEIKGLKTGEVAVWTVSGSEVWVNNVSGNDKEVVARESTWNGEGMFTFPKHSLTMLRWRT